MNKKAYVKCKKCKGKGFVITKVEWATNPKMVGKDMEIPCWRCNSEGKLLWIDDFFR